MAKRPKPIPPTNKEKAMLAMHDYLQLTLRLKSSEFEVLDNPFKGLGVRFLGTQLSSKVSPEALKYILSKGFNYQLPAS